MKDHPDSGVSKGVVLLIATISSFLTPFAGSTVNVALPSIGSGLALDAITLNWVVTAYMLAAAMFLLPFGRISDIYGRKRVFKVGITIFVAASIFCALSNSGPWLIAFRALNGLGGAMMYGTAVALLTSVFPPGERGRVLGMNAASTYCGLLIGPFAGGFVTQHFGWRSVFLLNATLGMIIIAAALYKFKGEWAGAKGQKFDYAGSAIYSLALAATIYGFSALPSVLGLSLISIGALALLVFIKWELRVESPILNIGFLRNNTVFAFSNLAAFINHTSSLVTVFLLSLYLQYIKGFTPEQSGLILMVQAVVMIICAPIAGSLSDKIEPFIVASLGMAMTTIGLSMLIFLGPDTGIPFILVSLVFLGSGYGLFSSPNANAVMGSVDKRFYGVAAGMLSTMRLTRQTFGMGMVLMLFAVYIGRVQITPEYYSQFLESSRTAFSISTALCFVGIFASIARGKTRKHAACSTQSQ